MTTPIITLKPLWVEIDDRASERASAIFIKDQMVATGKPNAVLRTDDASVGRAQHLQEDLPEFFVRFRYEAFRSALENTLSQARLDPAGSITRTQDPAVIEAVLQASYADVLKDPTRCPGFLSNWPSQISALASPGRHWTWRVSI